MSEQQKRNEMRKKTHCRTKWYEYVLFVFFLVPQALTVIPSSFHFDLCMCIIRFLFASLSIWKPSIFALAAAFSIPYPPTNVEIFSNCWKCCQRKGKNQKKPSKKMKNAKVYRNDQILEFLVDWLLHHTCRV